MADTIAQTQQALRQQRQQLEAIKTTEAPSRSQLLKRGMAGATSAREQQRRATIAKEQTLEEFGKYESGIKAKIQTYQKKVKAQQDYKYGYSRAISIQGTESEKYSPWILQDLNYQEAKGFRQGLKDYKAQRAYIEQPKPEFKQVEVPDWVVESSPYKDQARLSDPTSLFGVKPQPVPITIDKPASQIIADVRKPIGGVTPFTQVPTKVKQPMSDIKYAAAITAINPFMGIPMVLGSTVLKKPLGKLSDFVIKARTEVPETIGALQQVQAQKVYEKLYPKQTRIEPQIIGDVSKKVMGVGQYFVPVYGKALFFAPMYTKALEGRSVAQSYVKEHPLEAAAVVTLPFISVGIKALVKPIRTVKVKGKFEAKSMETIQPYVKGGVRIEKGGVFEMIKTPSYKVYETTRLRSFLGKSPKTIKTVPSKSYTLSTLKDSPILTSKGEILPQSGYVLRRVGAKGQGIGQGKLIEVTGGTSPLRYGELESWQRYTLSRGFEKEAGRIIPDIAIKSILEKEGVQAGAGTLGSRYVGRVKYLKDGGKEWTLFLKQRKLTSEFQIGLSEFKRAEGGIKTYSTSLYSKPFTEAIPRARGKVSVSTGVTKEFSPIFLDDLKTYTFKFAPTKTIPTGASLKQVAQTVKGVQLKPTPSKYISRPTGTLVPKVAVTSTIVGLKLGTSAIESLASDQKSIVETKQELKVTGDLGLETGQDMKTILKQDQVPISELKTDTALDQSLKTIQLPTLSLKTTASLIIKPQQAVKQRVTPKTSLTPPRVPTTKIPPIRKGVTLKKLKPQRVPKSRELYSVQVRRKGKFLEIGKLPYGRALRLGTKRSKQTLAQTFRLMPKGQTRVEDIQYKVPTRLFTKPKRPVGGLAFVERRGKTLTTKSEISALKKARKRKSGGMKWF